MQKLIWTNSDGDSIDLTSGNYGITNWEGFSNTSLNIQSQQVPFRDGAVFLDALLEQRELSVTLAMQDNGNLEDRYRMRRELIHALNPKLGEGYLIYKNDFIEKRIKCVAQVPLFETHNSNDSGTPKATLVWNACDPYWEDLEETEVVLDVLKPQVIENNGDVKCYPKIKISGNFSNYEIKNLANNKDISIQSEISGNLVIDTEVGRKSVETEQGKYKLKINSEKLNDLVYSEYLKKVIFVGNKNTCYLISKDNEIETASVKAGANLLGVVIVGDYLFICTDTEVLKTKDFINIETVLTGTGFKGIIYNEYIEKIIVYGSTIEVSGDGANWTSISFTSANPITAMSYSENNIIGVGIGFNIISQDGNSWTEGSYGTYTINSSPNIVFNPADNCFYVTIGTSSNNQALTFNDSTLEWSSIYVYMKGNAYYSPFLEKIVIVGYSGKYFVIGDFTDSQIEGVELGLTGGKYISQLNCIYVIGTQVVVKTNNTIYSNIIVSPSANSIISSYAENENGTKIIGTKYSIYISYDGYIWKSVLTTGSNYTYQVIYSKIIKSFFAISQNGIFKSVDGETWTSIYTFQSTETKYKIACSDRTSTIWIITENRSYVTIDGGINWNMVNYPSATGSYTNVIYESYYHTFFFTTTIGIIYQQSDNYIATPIAFVSVRNLNVRLVDIAFSNVKNRYIYVGYTASYTPRVYYTMVGETTAKLLPTPFLSTDNYPICVIWHKTMSYFLILSSTGNIYRSYDGYNFVYMMNVPLTNVGVFSEDSILGETSNMYVFEVEKLNAIEKLNANSDLNFSLEVGKNELSEFYGSGQLNATIRYRQKYNGV